MEVEVFPVQTRKKNQSGFITEKQEKKVAKNISKDSCHPNNARAHEENTGILRSELL